MYTATTESNETVSLEAIIDAFSIDTLQSSFGKGLDAIGAKMTKVAGFFDGRTDKMGDMGFTSINTSLSRKTLQDINYVRLSEAVVPVPVGLKKGFKDYLNALDYNVGQLERIKTDMLRPLTLWLANVISNPSDLSANSNVDIVEFKEIEYIKARDRLAKCFVNNTDNNKNKFGAVVSRNKDFPSIVMECEDLMVRMENIGKDEMRTMVMDVSNKIQMLLDILSGQGVKINKKQMQRLSDRVIASAKAVELYTVVYYQLMGLHTSLGEINELLHKRNI